VDTGSKGSLTGGAFVARQSKAAPKGHPTKWKRLDKPKVLSGVGDGTKQCTWSATVHGVDKMGKVCSYTAPVIDPDSGTDEPSAVPPLYGLIPMAERNTFMGTRHGVLHEVPEGMEDQIVWPKGTIHRRCIKAPSGHWMIPLEDKTGRDLFTPGVQQAFPSVDDDSS